MSVAEVSSLAALNAIVVTSQDLAAVWRGESGHWPCPEAAALDARIAALRAWAAAGGAVGGPSVMEAASIAALRASPTGPAFDRDNFDELIDFLDHMPW